jgi:hypothetical protein
MKSMIQYISSFYQGYFPSIATNSRTSAWLAHAVSGGIVVARDGEAPRSHFDVMTSDRRKLSLQHPTSHDSNATATVARSSFARSSEIMTTSGFTNTPVSKFLVFYTIAAALIVSLTDYRHYFYILVDRHLWGYGQFWRIATWQVCSSSAKSERKIQG